MIMIFVSSRRHAESCGWAPSHACAHCARTACKSVNKYVNKLYIGKQTSKQVGRYISKRLA